MTANEPIQGLPYPEATDAPDGPNQLKAVVDAVAPRLAMVFASTAARDAAITSPTAGMLALTGTGATLAEWTHDGTSWVELWSANSGRPYRQASGVATVASGNPVGTVDVTLPAGRFTQTPIVIATPDNSQYVTQYVPGNSSSSSIRIGIRQIAGGTWSTPRLAYWTAVQMTPSNPEG